MHEAGFYEKLDSGEVRCFLCAHGCRIKPGKRGICAVRENVDGTLYSLVYGRLVSLNASDPVEKKPLFHFLPGTRTLSLATVGCNLRCRHCQNHEISQYPHEHGDITGSKASPGEIVSAALAEGCPSISYTYTEPTIFMEFALDTARLARQKGLCNIFVSNGFMSPESAEAASGLIDAINIDLKGDAEFYKKICGARLEPVKETIKLMRARGVWVEVTTLVIEGHNDSDDTLGEIADFLYSVDPYMPWHLSAFYPTYLMMDRPRTSPQTIACAVDIGKKRGIKYVYSGNLRSGEGESTFCPECGRIIIKRIGYTILESNLNDSACVFCGAVVHGVFARRDGI